MDIILSGVQGKMGQHVLEAVGQISGTRVVAGVDRAADSSRSFPVHTDWHAVSEKADVIIDFSHHSAIDALLDYCQASGTPAVICTTGLSDSQVERIRTLSATVPLLRSGNMSVGVNLLLDLVARAAQTLYADYDIEIIEKHHNRKVDAPSGTAMMLAQAAKDAVPEPRKYSYGRQGNDCKRKPEEIGIHAIRGGTIVGEHSVIFAGADEIIEINHTALSRAVFASGATRAALFLVNQGPGLYSMKDVLK